MGARLYLRVFQQCRRGFGQEPESQYWLLQARLRGALSLRLDLAQVASAEPDELLFLTSTCSSHFPDQLHTSQRISTVQRTD